MNTEQLVKAAAKSVARKYSVDKGDLEQDIWVALLEDEKQDYHNRQGIYTIAHSKAIDMYRRTSRETAADLSETYELDLDEAEDVELGQYLTATTDGGLTHPEQDVLFADRVQAIKEHVEAIVDGHKSGQREVLEAYYLKGLDYLEAAQALGLPIGTVKSRLGRAREALGPVEAALRTWREFAYPGARRPDLDANRPHSVDVVAIWQG